MGWVLWPQGVAIIDKFSSLLAPPLRSEGYTAIHVVHTDSEMEATLSALDFFHLPLRQPRQEEQQQQQHEEDKEKEKEKEQELQPEDSSNHREAKESSSCVPPWTP